MMDFNNWFKKYEKLIGAIASIMGTIMFISLVEIFISNLQGKSNIFIQPLATSINCFFWSLYGKGKKDLFIFIPNFLGFVLGILTVISVFI